jgi:hypothetical protein
MCSNKNQEWWINGISAEEYRRMVEDQNEEGFEKMMMYYSEYALNTFMSFGFKRFVCE